MKIKRYKESVEELRAKLPPELQKSFDSSFASICIDTLFLNDRELEEEKIALAHEIYHCLQKRLTNKS